MKTSTRRAASPSAALTFTDAAHTTLARGKGAKNSETELLSMVIYKAVKENPRRVGSHGFCGFELYRDGMTVAQALAEGCRMRDILWDLDNKFITISLPLN